VAVLKWENTPVGLARRGRAEGGLLGVCFRTFVDLVCAGGKRSQGRVTESREEKVMSGSCPVERR
jgi:hypothetical protein